MDFPIRGMENVVATVSGYHGLDRFNLIKLISQSGASYVGAMSNSITHLVCWEFEGKKYDLAKKFRIIIVNHRWVEDCLKQGKRVPEHPYTLQSGKDAGPLLLDAPVIHDVVSLNKNRNALSDRSNISEYIEGKIDSVGWGSSGLAAQTDSDENLFCEMRKENSSAYKSKSKKGAKTSKQESRSRGRYCSQDPPLSVELEHDGSSSKSSMHSVRHKARISRDEEPSTDAVKRLVKGKRKISNDIRSTSLAESSFHSRRLVKENFSRDIMDIELLDSDQDFQSIGLHNKISKAAASSEHSDCELKHKGYGSGRTSTAPTNYDEDSAFQTIDDILEIRDKNSLKRPSGFVENSGDRNECSSQSEPVTRLPASEELSCVICWTEFSSTRGVLPCGHRFCYPCIQNWADHMIASRKTSTCPLCKVEFVSITKVEDAATSDQKIYSQTIPCVNSSTEILLINDQERRLGVAQSSGVCGECECREPEDLLIMCDHCHVKCIHIYCLDPPLLPWTCIHCKDLQRLLYQAR
ncbi:zinc finger (C3HC4-type RING finger) family protein / BRCT domain-containing protein [Euphorbia peplus]|nr:zinc finger (C3HC4-type RING finger) family protein / BRCT domain-containing protein [Euphorbia peplus]